MTNFKINLWLCVAFLVPVLVFSHNHTGEHAHLRQWHLEKENKNIEASFYMFKDGNVYLEDSQHDIKSVAFSAFSPQDQVFLETQINRISVLNHAIDAPKTVPKPKTVTNFQLGTALFLFLSLGGLIFFFTEKKRFRAILPLFYAGIALTLYSFTDPTIVNRAFLVFAPNVHTFWDANYFYVESKGIPTTHNMMVGISSRGWQQQVPVPQCYIGTNAWSIPLNPIIATTPVPVNPSHFSRGAIAIAVNGVPIFNPYTNTGVDAFLDGQLDAFGGHCGRADDYHYHTAPLHLYNQTVSTLPIAYALDGFAIFGNLEPDGSNMTTLDANHGHFFNGVYHYHGTAAAPYMIGNMVGRVTEDANQQLIPQAQARPVRNENWGPLNGALITACTANGTNNGYNLSYTLNGISGYATNYRWSGATYTFNYATPSATNTINYNGVAQCTVPLSAAEIEDLSAKWAIYPNPFTTNFDIANQTDAAFYTLFNNVGQVVFSGQDIKGKDFSYLSKGFYFLLIKDKYTKFCKLEKL